MSVRRKLHQLALGAAASALFAAGPLPGAQAYELAGSAGLASDAYWISLMCAANKAAESAGSTIEWYSLRSGTDNTEFQANLDALKISTPDGIVLGTTGLEPPAGYHKELMDGGVPIVYVNGQPAIDKDYLTGYRTAPAAESIAEIAAMVAADTGGEGVISILGGRAGSIPLEGRWKPLVEALKASAPGLEVLEAEYTSFDANKANEIVSAQIVANPNLKAVYTVTGPEGQGAAAAISAAGKSGEILVYSFDAIPLLQDALRDGVVRALIAQPPGVQGEQEVETLIQYLDANKGGGPVTPDTANQDQLIPTMVVTADNIDSPEAHGYLYKETCE